MWPTPDDSWTAELLRFRKSSCRSCTREKLKAAIFLAGSCRPDQMQIISNAWSPYAAALAASATTGPAAKAEIDPFSSVAEFDERRNEVKWWGTSDGLGALGRSRFWRPAASGRSRPVSAAGKTGQFHWRWNQLVGISIVFRWAISLGACASWKLFSAHFGLLEDLGSRSCATEGVLDFV